MSQLIIKGKKEYFTLSLLQFELEHPSISTPGYAIRLNPRSMELAFGPYFISLQEIFTELFTVIKKHRQLKLHMQYVPDMTGNSNYSRILLFISQRGKMDVPLIDILDTCQVTDTYLFSEKQIAKVVTLVNGTHFRINTKLLSDELIYSKTMEIGRHEFRHFMSMLENIRKTSYIKTSRSMSRLNDGIYLGNESKGYPVYIENMSSLLIIGSDDIIPSILNNRETLPALVVTRNTKEWVKHSNRQGGVQVLNAGDGMIRDEYQSDFSINLLAYCRKNPGLIYHLFQKLKVLTAGKYRDPSMVYELIYLMSKDKNLDEVELDFSTLLAANTQKDEVWVGSGLNALTAQTDALIVSYGDVLNKPFFQMDRGNLEYTGITVIDTSRLTDFEHTLICLTFLSLQETRMMDSWLVLSDFDMMDNKKYKSDLENLFYYANPNKLVLHFSRVYHIKSYYNKFKYSIFNEIDKIPMEVKESFGIANSSSDRYILKNLFDEFTQFTPVISIVNMDNVLGPKRSVLVDIEELEEEERMEEPEEEEEVEEESYSRYLEGAIISYLREGRPYSFEEIVLHFEPVEDIHIPLESLVRQNDVYHQGEGYGLNNSTRRNIKQMTNRISPSDDQVNEDEERGLSDYMLDMEVKFHENPDRQIVADLIYVLNLARVENKEVSYGYDLFIGLYREMLNEFDRKEIIASLGNILRFLNGTLDKSGFDTGDFNTTTEDFSDDVNEMARKKKEKEEEKKREYQESIREDMEDDTSDDEINVPDADDIEEDTEDEAIEKVVGKKKLPITDILKAKPKEGLENQPIHPDRLKPRFNGSQAHGWVALTEADYSLIDDRMSARHIINPDVFILTLLTLSADRKSRHKSALGIDYQLNNYIIPLNASINDMVDHRLVSMKKKGIRANDFQLRFGYKLSGVHITAETYREAISMIEPITVDELEEFYHSTQWRDKLRDIQPLEKKPIIYTHPVFSQLQILWRLTHYDTTMSDIDPIIMAIINLENLERKHLELLSIYFRLISNDQSIDKILEGTIVDNPRLRSVLNKILESINEIPEGTESEAENNNPVDVEVENPPIQEEKGEVKIKTIPRNAKGLEMLKPHLKFKSDEKKVMSIPKAKIRISEEKVPLENFFEKKEKEHWEKFDLGKVIEESLKAPLEKFRKPKKVGLKLVEEVIDEIKSIKTIDVIDYLGDVLGLVVRSLITQPKLMPLNLLVFVFNRSGYESMVATTPFTEGLVSTIELFDKGKRKEGVLSAFRDKILQAVDDLVYNDLFVERLEFHSNNIKEE